MLAERLEVACLARIRILARSIEEPLRQIVENAGEDAAVVLNAVKAGKDAYGYNAGTDEYGAVLEEGILDPAKVTRLALQKAASVAGLLLTTEIAEAPKDDEHSHGGAPGAMRDGYARSQVLAAITARQPDSGPVTHCAKRIFQSAD